MKNQLLDSLVANPAASRTSTGLIATGVIKFGDKLQHCYKTNSTVKHSSQSILINSWKDFENHSLRSTKLFRERASIPPSYSFYISNILQWSSWFRIALKKPTDLSSHGCTHIDPAEKRILWSLGSMIKGRACIKYISAIFGRVQPSPESIINIQGALCFTCQT